MKTVRIFLPYGAHMRFEGVDAINAPHPEYIAFTYLARDEKGNQTDRSGHAIFCTKVICGYSVEGA